MLKLLVTLFIITCMPESTCFYCYFTFSSVFEIRDVWFEVNIVNAFSGVLLWWV